MDCSDSEIGWSCSLEKHKLEDLLPVQVHGEKQSYYAICPCGIPNSISLSKFKELSTFRKPCYLKCD